MPLFGSTHLNLLSTLKKRQGNLQAKNSSKNLSAKRNFTRKLSIVYKEAL